MASFRKRGKTWEYRVSYKTQAGEYKTISKTGFTTKKAAVNEANRVEIKYSQGAKVSSLGVSLLDYWDRWLELYKSGKHSTVTEKRYETIGKQLKQYFGVTRELKSITKSDWQEFINEFAAGYDREGKPRTKVTVAKLNTYVRAMANAAVDDQIIYSNFTNNVVIAGKESEKKIKYLELSEFSRLVQYLLEFADFRSIARYMLLTGALTGARYSEVIALQWSDIDFVEKKLTINKTYDYRFRSGFTDTKTPSSVRTIDITDELVTALQKLKLEQHKAFFAQGYRDKNDMVFRSIRHNILSDPAVNKSFAVIQKNLGFDHTITFHGLRHTHASFLIAKHIDIAYISKRLGHANTTITQNVYAHLLKQSETEQANASITALSDISG